LTTLKNRIFDARRDGMMLLAAGGVMFLRLHYR
jgi:hypothetical protein